MSKRIVFTFATGAPQYTDMALGLGLSLSLHHSETKRVLITDRKPENGRADRLLPLAFDELIEPPKNFSHWFIKLCMLQETDADQILFIDSDGLALRNIDGVFDELAGTKFCVQGAWRSDFTQWYGDINGAMKKLGLESIPQFNGGLIYYERCDEVRQLIMESLAMAERFDDLGLKRLNGRVTEEVCISLAMATTGIGKVVPMSRAYSVTPWMMRGKKRLDVVAGECSFVKVVDRPRAFSPMIYHTAQAKWDIDYWRELNRILRMHDDVVRLGVDRDTPKIPFQKFKRVAVMLYRKMIGL
ncbi:MAG TPA: hypothetical protein VNI20_05005 [Fimbriimonadaceae bacterium]|nr:hypothetical protein [Fimbriimonadaceae bacterium]